MNYDWFRDLGSVPVSERADVVAAPVAAALGQVPSARVFEIDPGIAETAELCAHYGWPLESCANCVIVTGRRGEVTKHVACMALATTRVDVNSLVRKRLGVRKASFAAMDFAVEQTGMEYGGITPVGLPADWPIWVDAAVAASDWVCIGSGTRRSKLILPAAELLNLPGAERVESLAG